MIHEYAVAPELVARWADHKEGRHFIDKFRIGSSRIISRYPRKQWKKQVWTAWQARSRDSQSDRKRMRELIKRLSHVMVQRLHAGWRPDRSWTENAVEEHRRIPFHAILAADDAVQDPSVLFADDVDGANALWGIQRSRIVPRRAVRIAGVMRDMLRAATDIVFIDPYFTPNHPRYVDVIGACVRASRERRAVGDSRIRIFGAVRDGSEESEFFKEGCQEQLSSVLPRGQEATICRLSERSVGEKLHNRYILTEHGGVAFGQFAVEFQ